MGPVVSRFLGGGEWATSPAGIIERPGLAYIESACRLQDELLSYLPRPSL